jgi:hypothetical protein
MVQYGIADMLFLDGVYVERPDGSLSFRWVKEPSSYKAPLCRPSLITSRKERPQ